MCGEAHTGSIVIHLIECVRDAIVTLYWVPANIFVNMWMCVINEPKANLPRIYKLKFNRF